MAVLIEYIQKHYPWLSVSSILNSIICSLLIAVIFKWLWEKRKMYILSIKLPGPTSLPFIGSLLTIGCCWPKSEKLKSILTEYLKYPSPFRVWYFSKFVVVLSDVEDVQALIEDNTVSIKPYMFYFWSCGIGNGLWTGQGGSNWWIHRSILNPAFSMESLPFYQKIMEKHCLKLKDDIAKHCSEEPINIKNILEIYCTQVMSEILLGDTNLHNEQCVHLIRSMDKIRILVNNRINKFWLHPDVIFQQSKSHKELLHHKKILRNYIIEILNYKKIGFGENKFNHNSDSTKTVMDLLIDAQRCGHDLSDEEIIEEIMSLFYKGVDSFSTILTFFILMISMHKNCRNNLTKEIDNFCIENVDSFNLQNIEKLQFLNNCYKETLRLFPYGALLTKHANNDVVLKQKNIVIPNGTIIAIPTYLTNLNPKYWPEPEIFKPERYIEENKLQYSLYYFSLFGTGQRNCIGEKMGSYLIKSTIINFLKCYELQSDEKIENLQISFDTSIRLPLKCNVSIAKKI